MPPGRRRLVVQWAADGEARLIKHVGVDHRRGHVLVAKQFLHRANIIPVLQQMCSETVPPRKSYADAVGVIGFLLR